MHKCTQMCCFLETKNMPLQKKKKEDNCPFELKDFCHSQFCSACFDISGIKIMTENRN